MFKVATSDAMCRAVIQYPSVFAEEFEKHLLKPLGHAFIIEWIQAHGPANVLEVGHGATSFTFDVCENSAQFWGLDGLDLDNTVSSRTLRALRDRYATIQFVDGYLGDQKHTLPEGHFDLIYSVSVLEHISEDDYKRVFADIHRLLKPGGVHVHSYDVWWGKPMRPMYDAIAEAGFEFVGADADMSVPWERWIGTGQSDASEAVQRAAFEYGDVVFNVFASTIPPHQRCIHNYTSIQIAARKSATEDFSGIR